MAERYVQATERDSAQRAKLQRKVPHPQAPAGSQVSRNLVGLQRAAGNRAVLEALGHGTPPRRAGHPPDPVVQRAIGFEFEFGTWTTKRKNGSRLDKGEEIIRGPGYKIEGEDGPGADSAIEAVTKPYATVGEATTSITDAQKKLKNIKTAGGTNTPPNPVKASAFGGVPSVRILPGQKVGKMQASPAVALDAMAELYRQGAGQSYAGFVAGVERHLADKKVKKKYLGGGKASEELKGFLLLVLSYLEQGSRKQALFYPKSAFTIMARTSFNKMFSLVPEHAFFSQRKNLDKWVELVLVLAQRMFPSFREQETGKVKKKGPFGLGGIKYVGGMAVPKKRKRSLKEIKREAALGAPLMGMEPLPGDAANSGYTSTVTREDWLRNMPRKDLLSKARDKRFEGMGAYGDAVDVEVTEDQMVEETEEAVENAVNNLGITTDAGGGAKAPREAPLFELRGLRDMFAIDQDVDLDDDWSDKVKDVFAIVDQANQGEFKPGGKPTVAPDRDKPSAWKKI